MPSYSLMLPAGVILLFGIGAYFLYEKKANKVKTIHSADVMEFREVYHCPLKPSKESIKDLYDQYKVLLQAKRLYPISYSDFYESLTARNVKYVKYAPKPIF